MYRPRYGTALFETAGPWHHPPDVDPPPNLALVSSIYVAVFARFVLSFVTLAASLAALVTVAAFADGRAPDPRRIGQVVGGFAPAVAAVWVLLDLRRNGEDIAVASLGARPTWIAALLLVCAAPLFALDRPAVTTGITATADRLTAPGLTIEWRDAAAWRADLTQPFEGLPPPPEMSASVRSPLFHAALRLSALALGLLGLLRWREPPGLIAGLAVAGLVFWAGA